MKILTGLIIKSQGVNPNTKEYEVKVLFLHGHVHFIKSVEKPRVVFNTGLGLIPIVKQQLLSNHDLSASQENNMRLAVESINFRLQVRFLF